MSRNVGALCRNGENMQDVILKQFEDPDEVRVFEKGRFEVVHVGGITIGRATYQPGWKWSQHIAPVAGVPLCEIEHVGMVVSGRAVAAFADGTQTELTPGNLFYIPPVPHDSWVVGEEPYVSIHFLGAAHYAK
ncbi:MAG TPA: cupin domain-containing protein [Candidatus Acidoferrum sp.]